MKNRVFKQSTITSVSVLAGVVIAGLLLGGIWFTNSSTTSVQTRQEREQEMGQLGQQVRASSILLTDTVRLYVMTGDRRYLDEYWHEIEVTQSQAEAIARLQELGVEERDLALVEEASANSAQLVETETRAMRLALEAAGVGPSDMPSAVAGYTLSSEDAALGDEAKLRTAQRILFDSNYEGERARIMGPLDRFAETLERQAAEATADATGLNRIARFMLVAVGLVIPLAFGLLLWLVHTQMSRPITHYVRNLGERDVDDRDFRLEPDGTEELRALAGALNQQLDRGEELVKAIGASSQDTAGQASVVSAASEQVSQNVTTVATAVEEMNASIHEIAQSANDAAKVAQEAVHRAAATNETVSRLGTSSKEIGAVVEAIKAIAEQTNLLALNATIEAARAGEAGKGFAVVAGEVKELSQQTARATEDIAAKVAAIQSDTGSAVEEIRGIAEIIDRISSYQQTISSAVDEQTATAAEIASNISEAAQGVTEVAEGITNVATAAQAAGQGLPAAEPSTAAAGSGYAREDRVLAGV